MKRYTIRRLTLALVGATLAVAGGCSGATTDNGGSVGEVQLSMTALDLRVGANAAITARVVDASGEEVVGRKIFWSSRDTRIATVDEGGVVTGVAPGSTEISASTNGVSAVAAVTVLPRPIVVFQIEPASVQLVVGSTSKVTARALDDAGGTVAVTPAWQSRNPGVATVGSDGTITAVAPGSTEISASANGVSAVAAVTVLPRGVAVLQVDPTSVQLVVGATRKVTARALDDAGGTVTTTLAWQSSDPRIATVGSDGTITAVAPGVATVTVSANGRSASVAVVVTPVPVASVRVSPTSQTIRIGETVQLSAVPVDASGQPVAGRTVQWSTNDQTIVSVSSSGQVLGLKDGSATVNATVDGVSASVAITVQKKPVASIAVSPASSTIAVGTTLKIVATPTDAGGATLERAVTYSSDATSIATVSTDGTVTGVAPGNTNIRATSEGVTGTASVRVVTTSGPAVASVQVTPATVTLRKGQSQTFQATARASNGSTITGRTVTWLSSNTSRLTVSSSGVATAVVEGPATAQVIAEIDGVTGTALVTIERTPVATVAVSPATSTLQIGGTVQLSAAAKDESGATLDGRSITWSSSDQAVATVDANGKVTAVRAGTATIRATSEGVIGTAQVTVASPAPAPAPTTTLRLDPASATIKRDGRVDLALYTKTGDAAEVLVPPGTSGVSWTSSNQAVATVNGNGRVMPKTVGTVTVTASYLGATASSSIKIEN